MTLKQMTWTKEADKYMELTGITNCQWWQKTNQKKEQENRISNETTPTMFMERKKEIKEDQVYNNRPIIDNTVLS